MITRLPFFLIITILTISFKANSQNKISIPTGLAEEDQLFMVKNKTISASPTFLNQPIKKSLPISLEQYIPRVLNQGTQGSCTAFAVAAALSIRENRRNSHTRTSKPGKPQILYSPTYLWVLGNKGRPSNLSCESPGISYSTVFSCIFTNKLVLWGDCPYDTTNNNLCRTPCPPTVLSKKFLDRRFVFNDVILKVEAFKTLLNQGYPICIATEVDLNFYNALEKPELKGLWASKSKPNGEQHAMVIVDYDDDKQLFKVLDSHGVSKGDKGFIWLPYKLVNRDLDKGVVYGCYTVSFDKEASNGPEKDLFYLPGSNGNSDLFVKKVKIDSVFKGKVVDSKGLAIVGATIRAVDEPRLATSTNINGEFQIKALASNIFSINYLGFESTAVSLKYKDSTTYNDNKTTAWIKEGYYRIFNGLKFGIINLNKDSQSVLLSIKDDDSGKAVINNIELAVKDEIEFSVDENRFKIKLAEIKNAGSIFNIVNPNASFLDIELISDKDKLTEYF